ncbi:hypothetical protein AWRI3579_g966 [Hanseniaspora osmophila]|uniref:Uncharacterized protein n=1 Tax=Hanseniaspora osmophila TaxID=56408 RepID=A0A1E5RNL2_9ASCO|nr:hypothetical protein AWRI3579_g966 [Hanseniaspora osmophila]
MITILSVLVLGALFFRLSFSATLTSTQPLNPTQAAALADYPLVSAFVSNLGVSTGYLLQDYQSYATAVSTQIPNEVLNYFQIIEAVSDYQELQREMLKTFPFQGFQSFIAIFPWYSTLLQEAQMTTYYLPQDFASSSASTTSSKNDFSNSFSSLSLPSVASSTVYVTASSTQRASANTSSVSSYTIRTAASTGSSSVTKNYFSQSALSSTTTTTTTTTSLSSLKSSKSSNHAIKTMQMESLGIMAFLLAFVFAV